MNTGCDSKQTTCLCRDTGGKGTLLAQHTSFSILGSHMGRWWLKKSSVIIIVVIQYQLRTKILLEEHVWLYDLHCA